ncbi:MAG: hypothetical protein G01um10145_849 [Microgenomates group bacterium Gr01-1014_5]|nr:MAG: hypothetical protein G01um10145_849 [Microgenomates group bacterium Gr01-1014_5]
MAIAEFARLHLPSRMVIGFLETDISDHLKRDESRHSEAESRARQNLAVWGAKLVKEGVMSEGPVTIDAVSLGRHREGYMEIATTGSERPLYGAFKARRVVVMHTSGRLFKIDRVFNGNDLNKSALFFQFVDRPKELTGENYIRAAYYAYEAINRALEKRPFTSPQISLPRGTTV